MSTSRRESAKTKILKDELEKRCCSKSGIIDNFYTLATFVCFITLIPFIVSLYFMVAICRILWLRLLEHRFPELEFVRTTSVRTCVDTLRNQGIITLLLEVSGECSSLDRFKAQIKTDILERRKEGKLLFPHLTMTLTSKYGRYAWIPKSSQYFNIENHVTTSPTFRGRPVTDANIQECVSDIVLKYFPVDMPPWQVTVINCNRADKFYLLVRLHHLYLTEDNLGPGDLLMLKPSPSSSFISEEEDNQFENQQQREIESRNNSLTNPDSTQHLLAGAFKTPTAIPEVYEHICETFANTWNELVSVYDPLENVAINKKSPTLKNFFVLLLIINVSVMKELSKSNKSDIFRVFRIESQRRGFTVRYFWKCLFTTLRPSVMILSFISWSWFIYVKCILHIPVTIMHAIRDTPLYIYRLVMLLRVTNEILYLIKVIYTGPRVLLEEILFPQNPEDSHHLQTVSLCGRKVVRWSDPISLDRVKRIRDATGAAASCEIILAATNSALKKYFRRTGTRIPRSVVTVARFMPQEELLKGSSSLRNFGSPVHDAGAGGGLLCLPLPTHAPSNDLPGSLQALRVALYRAKSHQAALYLASVYRLDYRLLPKVLPTVCARVLLNMLSRRYAVTLTQVDNSSATCVTEKRTRRLLWGQEVENIMYWRPPQANISMSLTLMSYGDSVRLGVMTDAQLADYHKHLPKDFCNYINKLEVSVAMQSNEQSQDDQAVSV